MFEEGKYYKESGRFSPIGAVLITLCVAVLGVVVFYLYLLFNNWCTLVYLNIFVALAAAALLGFVVSKISGLFKIRNKTVVLVCAVIGFVLASYIKWAMYDCLDVKKYRYEPMKEQTADSYYDFSYYFDLNGSVDTQSLIDVYKSIHQSTTFMNSSGEVDYSGYDLSDDEIKKMEKTTVWDYNNFEKLLGKDAEEVDKSLEKAKDMNAYEFTFKYRKAEQEKTLLHLLTSPGELWTDIKAINEYGRWSYSSSSYKEKDNVKGVLLWIVWAGEFLLMGFIYLLVTSMSFDTPFIESENDWAVHKGLSPKHFCAPNDINEFKNSMELSEFNLFELEPDPSAGQLSRYITVDIYHSKAYDENYANFYLNQITIQSGKPKEQKTQIIKLLRVSKEFVMSDRLWN